MSHRDLISGVSADTTLDRPPLPGVPGPAGRLVDLALLLLPRHQRLRYLEEWTADLASLDPGRRLAYAVRLLLRSPHLGAVLRRSQIRVPRRSLPLPCRFGSHRWREEPINRDEMRVLTKRCRRCGRFRDSWDLPAVDPDTIAWGGIAGSRVI